MPLRFEIKIIDEGTDEKQLDAFSMPYKTPASMSGAVRNTSTATAASQSTLARERRSGPSIGSCDCKTLTRCLEN
jgi:hypothetical protein